MVGRAALAVIDTQGEAHWWMNTRANFFTPYFLDYPYLYSYLYPFRWLPDGRLLWVDEACQVFVWDGQNRRDLGAPERMGNVQYASGDIAFAAGGGLWRVDVSSGTWERVTSPRPPKYGVWNFPIVAQDGSYGLDFQHDETSAQMWRIPAEMGAVAEPLPDLKGWVEPPGHGGPSGPPSTQLAGTSYWLLNNVGVVNERDGSILTVRDLQLPEGYHIWDYRDYRASPDGQWLAVIINHDPQRLDEQADVYITPSTDLTAGRIVKGVSVAGWHADAPAVIFRDNTTGVLSVARLPAGAAAGAVLKGATRPVVTLPDRLLAVDAGSPARMLQFDLDGNLLNTLDLSANYDSIISGVGAMGRVFLGATSGQDQGGSTCPCGLVEWTVGP